MINKNSSHICIFNSNQEVLLLKRSKEDEWEPNRWSIPGGRRKENETLLQNIVRETKEETGLDIFPDKIRYLPEISQKLNHIFFATSKYSGNIKLDHENSEFGWFKYENIDEKQSVPNLKEEIRAGISKMFPKYRIWIKI